MKSSKKTSNDVVFQEERLDKILALFEKENRLVTKDLPEKFNTTSVTIRKDLGTEYSTIDRCYKLLDQAT